MRHGHGDGYSTCGCGDGYSRTTLMMQGIHMFVLHIINDSADFVDVCAAVR